MKEDLGQFEKRKREHIELALEESVQGVSESDWDQYQLQHEAFPEIDFQEVELSTSFFSSSLKLNSPVFISSMTAWHDQGELINSRLASLSERYQILMGTGSQRKEIDTPEASREWKTIKLKYPRSLLLGNLGLTQIITTPVDKILKIVDSMQALALIVHTNPMQEVLQDEGTPQFKGGLHSLENLCRKISVPVIVKEVGFGFSAATLLRLNEVGIAAVDLSGKGGTHWGRIEGLRSQNSINQRASRTFANWGRTPLSMLRDLSQIKVNYQTWASGGIRNGLDMAKCLSLGAHLVGVAQPWLKAALNSEEDLDQTYHQFTQELKMALFCTGSRNVKELRSRKVGLWQKV